MKSNNSGVVFWLVINYWHANSVCLQLVLYFSGSGVIQFSDLPDLQNCYAGLLCAHTELADVKVVVPDVLDMQGILISPTMYDAKFKDNAFVEIEVYLKFWNISGWSGGDNNSSPSRVYQLVLKHMKLLPYHLYTKEAMLRATEAGTAKKRKVSFNSDDDESKSKGQGPAKKTAIAGPSDEMEGVEL
ncbi:hypothetical protein J3R83DRAFT_9042 [Lanmaoa asiatica]|nr:hypothetical protein J3R83DRAFT_9042 [Lanmaoa asiatica]